MFSLLSKQVYLAMVTEGAPDGELLLSLVRMRMPFGKYKGIVLCNLPVSYLEWFAKKGFPPGKLGMLLATLYEIKINGLEYLLTPLKNSSQALK
jgi:uncharacterized protein (DUF3820 family)